MFWNGFRGIQRFYRRGLIALLIFTIPCQLEPALFILDRGEPYRDGYAANLYIYLKGIVFACLLVTPSRLNNYRDTKPNHTSGFVSNQGSFQQGEFHMFFFSFLECIEVVCDCFICNHIVICGFMFKNYWRNLIRVIILRLFLSTSSSSNRTISQ